jgi:outer membrane lipoprotein SlyB
VICSDKVKQKHFDKYHDSHVTEDRAGMTLGGGMLGATLGGLTAIAGLSTLGGIGVVVAGAMGAALAGGVAGSFAAAMMSRGIEKEPADYYDLAVQRGKILVAVEDTGPNQEQRLKEAAMILDRAGAEPIALSEG